MRARWGGPGAPGLGPGFGRFWAADTTSTVGDGVTLTAAPLLVLTLTDDPGLVAGSVFVQYLPWLLFSLPSGALADRLDRRRALIGVDVARATVMTVLAVLIVAGAATLWLLYAGLFLLGVGDTLARSAANAMVPRLVPADALARANARIAGGQLVGNQLAAPPLGAALFVVAAAAPFWFDAATFAVAALLLASLRPGTAPPPVPLDPAARTTLRQEIHDGVRYLWHQAGLRLLGVLLCLMNITFFGVFAIWALYARERLGLGPLGYGALLTALACGALAATVVVDRLLVRFGPAALLRAGLVIETCTHLGLALTTTPAVAAAIMVGFGAHVGVLSVVSATLRQQLSPEHLMGRVNSVYLLLSSGGAAIGALSGGIVARSFGITAPFWVAFTGMVVLTAGVWRLLAPRAFASP